MALTKTLPTANSLNVRDDEGYRRAADRLAELRARAEALDRRRGELVSGLSRIVAGARLDARAEQLLRDDVVPRPGEERDQVRRVLEEVEDELAVLRRAIDLQARIVEETRARVSAAICKALQPHYKAVVSRIASAMTELSEALDEEAALRDQLRDGDVLFAGRLRPMPFPPGRLADPNSPASAWLRDAREHGLLGPEVRR